MEMHVSNSDDVGDDDKILRLRDVEAIVGLKRSTIYRKISEGLFLRISVNVTERFANT